MSVRFEFFGIPRERAGVTAIDLRDPRTLGEALCMLSQRLPALADTCFHDSKLKPGYLANVNGERFTTDPDAPLRPGDAVLILSADAGG
jgi:molybdopterin converting factor small subunit